jgi:hypothetical protein
VFAANSRTFAWITLDFLARTQYLSHVLIADFALNHPLDGMNPIDETKSAFRQCQSPQVRDAIVVDEYHTDRSQPTLFFGFLSSLSDAVDAR